MSFELRGEEFVAELDHPGARLGRLKLDLLITRAAEETDPHPEALAVLEIIVEHLKPILAIAERALRDDYERFNVPPATPLGKVIEEPAIWIDGSGGVHNLARGEWTLLVGLRGQGRDRGWHLDFEGKILRELWRV
jgi:hypothetical protein